MIDKVTDSDGAERRIPERACEPALTSDVAAAVGYALQGVMASGGTGSSANPYDGTPVLGKTGTHEGWNTWMIESSTKVTTAVWVGNWRGIETLFGKYWNGQQLSDMRYSIARATQSAADEFYGGDAFPDPPSNALRTKQADLPNVVGQSIDSGAGRRSRTPVSASQSATRSTPSSETTVSRRRTPAADPRRPARSSP